MKQIALLFSFLLTSICFSQEMEFSMNQIVLKLKANNDFEDFGEITRIDHINDSLSLVSFKVIGNKKIGKTYLLKFAEEINVKAAIDVYKNTGLFEYVEPNYICKGHGVLQTTPNDPFFNRQWPHYNDGSFPLSQAVADADIDTDLAWDITQGDPNLIVAILDSGLKLDHPEFAGRIVPGYDFVNNDEDPTDDNGHGTNVAGIALAKGNNSNGYAGVNWNSKIMVCKILDSGNLGYYDWWADAIYFAVDNGAKVINMSVGGNSPSTLLKDAIDYAYHNDVSVVVSTGNQNSVIQFPARYANAIAVGSTDANDTRSNPFFWDPNSGSNFGAELDFVAPGNYIYGLSFNSNTNYNSYWGGTSQAAPHVAGVISLLLSVNPDLSVSEIRQILEESSEDQVGDVLDTMGWDKYYGHGRINAFNAVSSPLLSNSEYYLEASAVKIFPNPTSGEGNFSISGLTPDVHHTIQVFAIDGKKILETGPLKAQRTLEINTGSMQPGVYMIHIHNLNNKNIISKKMVKN